MPIWFPTVGNCVKPAAHFFHLIEGNLSWQAKESADSDGSWVLQLYCVFMGAVRSCRAGQGELLLLQATPPLRSWLASRTSFLWILLSHPDIFFFNYLKMTSLDPLKSAISIGNVDDTSLALPSFNQCRSGQQRVLEQVQTIKRSKSRHSSSRNGSTSLSPASKNPQGPVQILHTTFVFFLGWFLSF